MLNKHLMHFLTIVWSLKILCWKYICYLTILSTTIYLVPTVYQLLCKGKQRHACPQVAYIFRSNETAAIAIIKMTKVLPKKVQKKCYRNSKEVGIRKGERKSVLLWESGKEKVLLDGIGRLARNLKKMGRKEETNQKGQQEQSHRGQKLQDLFRKVQFAESLGCI